MISSKNDTSILEIACNAIWNDQSGPLIQYTPPSNEAEVIAWAQQSIETRATSQISQKLRRERKLQNTSLQAFIIFVLSNVSEPKSVTTKGAYTFNPFQPHLLGWYQCPTFSRSSSR